MSLQFDRQYALDIFNDAGGQLEVRDLRVTFEVTKTLLGYPNRGVVEIYNLGEDDIQRITQKFSTLRLFAGYRGRVKQIFEANVKNFYKSRSNPDSIFTFITSGASRAWDSSVFSRTYTAGTSANTVIEEVGSSFDGVQLGARLSNPEWPALLGNATFSGSSSRVMDQLSREYNFDWAIDQQEVNVIPRGFALEDLPLVEVTPDTGLIGSPTLTELGADFRILMNPDLIPGRRIEMRADFVQLGQSGIEFRRVRTTADGIYKIMEVRHICDSRGQDWYTDIIAWRIGDEPRKDEN